MNSAHNFCQLNILRMSVNAAKEDKQPFIVKTERKKKKNQPEKIGVDLDFLRRLFRLSFVLLGKRRTKQLLVIFSCIMTAVVIALLRVRVATFIGRAIARMMHLNRKQPFLKKIH